MKILIDGQTLSTPEINRGIGTYFKNVVENMLRNDFVNEFYINTPTEKILPHLSKWSSEKLNPIVDKSFSPGQVHSEGYMELSKVYTETLDKVIATESIDIYWNPNPLMENVFLPEKKASCIFAATIYDLIPLVMKDIYLGKWPKILADTYMHKLELIKDYDVFFHISQATQNDFKRFLDVEQKKHVITPLAADNSFTYYPFPKIPAKEDYILYVSGFDPRKNMGRAIDAFAKLVKNYSHEKNIDQLKLFIVCASNERQKKELLQQAEKRGVLDKVHFTGFVSKDDLVKYYQKARCLFFPSLYEGFGLPILEAFACGIPVACSNTSSMPEVGGGLAQYFNPENTDEMAEALYKALNEKSDYDLRVKRNEYARRFSWHSTSLILLDTLASCSDRRIQPSRDKRRIAWLSPIPPQKSGIANYSYGILQELKKYFYIDLYYSTPEPPKQMESIFKCFPISEFRKNLNNYDEVVYHIGNSSEFHTDIYKLAWDYPGTVVLHDYNIHPFLQYAFLGKKDELLYQQALVEGYGSDGAKEYEKIKWGVHPDISNYPMSQALVNRSKNVIVHHVWAKKNLKNNANVHVIPHFAKINHKPSKEEIDSYKRRYKIKDTDFVISCLGFINKNKLPLLQIDVINKLIGEGYPIKLVFAGMLSPELKDLQKIIKKTKHTDSYVVTGYQSESEYYSSIFASDIVINLRNPSMGEASGTLMQSLAAGIPSIVSDLRPYKEYPDDICPKIPIENSSAILEKNIKFLLSHKNITVEYFTKIEEYAKQFDIVKIGGEYNLVLSMNVNLQFRLPKSEKIFYVTGYSKDDSVIGAIHKNNGYYEPHITAFLSNSIKSDFTCLDIGANIGLLSLVMGHKAVHGKVYSFEPSKNNFNHLRYNIAQNNLTNVNPLNLGVLDTNSDTTLHYVEKVAGCSFMSDVNINEGRPERVRCVRLDDWVAESKIKRLDFIKMDVEGAELKAINGGIDVITNLRPDLIIEFNPTPMKRFFNENPLSLYELLTSLYPHIYLISDVAGALIKIVSYDQLNGILEKGKGWEDLYCSHRSVH